MITFRLLIAYWLGFASAMALLPLLIKAHAGDQTGRAGASRTDTALTITTPNTEG
jgi:hypothetical protein